MAGKQQKQKGIELSSPKKSETIFQADGSAPHSFPGDVHAENFLRRPRPGLDAQRGTRSWRQETGVFSPEPAATNEQLPPVCASGLSAGPAPGVRVQGRGTSKYHLSPGCLVIESSLYFEKTLFLPTVSTRCLLRVALGYFCSSYQIPSVSFSIVTRSLEI